MLVIVSGERRGRDKGRELRTPGVVVAVAVAVLEE